MNTFVKALIVKFLRASEADLKPKLQAFLVNQGDRLLEGVIQSGEFRAILEAFLVNNVTVATNYLFDEAIKFLESA